MQTLQTSLIDNFKSTRKLTVDLCANLEIEDYGLQAIDDASPPKWHLGHTTWFFENFILREFSQGYRIFDNRFHFIFNSYYKGAGEHIYRPNRGLLSRPTVKQVKQYREYVNEHMLALLAGKQDEADEREIWRRLEIGIHHEQQHQELLITDCKYNFWSQPFKPAMFNAAEETKGEVTSLEFLTFDKQVVTVGAAETGFCFDNELPAHEALVHGFALANRLITNDEFIEFIEEGAYSKAHYWLSDGWDYVNQHNIEMPQYWQKEGNEYWCFTASGMQRVIGSQPVCHLSFFEADAFARFKGLRLPTEFEWEVAVNSENCKVEEGTFLEAEFYHPTNEKNHSTGLKQAFGDVWEWTTSSYLPYPGYQPLAGTLGEYNGKFMNAQRVLKGGSCVTPVSHIRASYRNFFQSDKRWQFTGLRLAKDLD